MLLITISRYIVNFLFLFLTIIRHQNLIWYLHHWLVLDSLYHVEHFYIILMKVRHLASPAIQEIRKRNNIQYLEKWEIFFSFAYLSAVWLQFGQNPVQKCCLIWFQLDFAQIVTKQLIDKQNKKIFLISPNIKYWFFCEFLA